MSGGGNALGRVRETPVLLGAGLVAALAAWELRGHARPLVSGSAKAHALAGSVSHHGPVPGQYVPPPDVVGDALANQVGLVALAVLPAAAGIACAAALTRRLFTGRRPALGMTPRLVFAALAALSAALVTAAVAGAALGSAVTALDSLESAVQVLRTTFVGAVLATAVLGPPWRTSPADHPADHPAPDDRAGRPRTLTHAQA